MATPHKTASPGTTLLSLQTLATASVAIGSAVDVSGSFSGMAYVQFARTVTTALTNAVQFRIDVSPQASANGQWYPYYAWQSDITTAVVPTATAGSAGGNSITLTNTGLVVGDRIFIKNGTLANSEFNRIVTLVSTTSITLEDNLINAQTTSVISNKAEWWPIYLDLTGVSRVRLAVSTAGPPGNAGQTVAVAGVLVTNDSIY